MLYFSGKGCSEFPKKVLILIGILNRMSDDDLELLAPWNETVKAEIERRANESNQSYVNCQGAPTTEK